MHRGHPGPSAQKDGGRDRLVRAVWTLTHAEGTEGTVAAGPPVARTQRQDEEEPQHHAQAEEQGRGAQGADRAE